MLHEKNAVRDELLDEVFASSDLSVAVPKYKMPEQEQDPRHAYQIVADELMLDGNSRQNLATFCQTWLEPEVKRLMDLAIDKNMIDKDEYPQTAELEERCVHMIADLWNSPDAANTLGTSTTGSSEAAMLGGLALKWKWRAAQGGGQALRQAQSGMWSGADLLAQVRPLLGRRDPRDPAGGRRLIMNAAEAVKRCDENTIGVVPTLGVTFTGHYEPVQEVSDALDKLQAETGLDIPIHVDAASGGFLAPFTCPELLWDFRLPRVKSINTSGHKFGLAPLGVGWIVWRDKSDLPEKLIFNVNYLGGNMPTFALNFSRPAARSSRSTTTFSAWARRVTERSIRPVTTRRCTWPSHRQDGSVRDALQRRPATGNPRCVMEAQGKRRSRLHSVRLGRSSADARLVVRLHNASQPPGHGGAADSRQARLQPRLGQPALARLRGRCCPFRQASGDDSAVRA